MRRPLMAGNWKMYKTPAETHTFFEAFKPLVAGASHCDIVICPSFPNLHAAVTEAVGTQIAVGAQNLYWGMEGAVTGEVSGHMLQAADAPTSSSRTAKGGSTSRKPSLTWCAKRMPRSNSG